MSDIYQEPYMTTDPQCFDYCGTCCKRRMVKVINYDYDKNGELIKLPDTMEWTCPFKEA